MRQLLVLIMVLSSTAALACNTDEAAKTEAANIGIQFDATHVGLGSSITSKNGQEVTYALIVYQARDTEGDPSVADRIGSLSLDRKSCRITKMNLGAFDLIEVR